MTVRYISNVAIAFFFFFLKFYISQEMILTLWKILRYSAFVFRYSFHAQLTRVYFGLILFETEPDCQSLVSDRNLAKDKGQGDKFIMVIIWPIPEYFGIMLIFVHRAKL